MNNNPLDLPAHLALMTFNLEDVGDRIELERLISQLMRLGGVIGVQELINLKRTGETIYRRATGIPQATREDVEDILTQIKALAIAPAVVPSDRPIVPGLGWAMPSVADGALTIAETYYQAPYAA